jgi:sodium transport system ATP-binding protein
MPQIEALDLRKAYHLSRGRTVEAVKGASFSVEAGEIFGLLGPNGAGKTTLLRMLGTIISPTSGDCRIAGTLTRENPDEVRRHIGFLSGNTKLYGRMTGREILRYFGRLYGMAEDAIARRTEELCAVFQMNDFVERRCDTLSTGQTQRLSIARVLLHDPPVLIMDEPTLGLDIMSSRTIIEFIRDAKLRGKSVIFSTHYMTEAEALCDRVALIHEGRIFAEGTVPQLLEQTGTHDLQAAFLAIIEAGNPVA